jgi:hypothetical protein
MKLPLSFFLIFYVAVGFSQPQQSEDSYTRYELLEPLTHSFRILYEVSATTAGAQYFYNTLRKGSDHKVETVWDMMTGKNLEWSIVSGIDAKKSGFTEGESEGEYLKIKLDRLVSTD